MGQATSNAVSPFPLISSLQVRALAGAAARLGGRRVALFARKGADCLGKFSGDAERTLRLMFDEVGLLAHPGHMPPASALMLHHHYYSGQAYAVRHV